MPSIAKRILANKFVFPFQLATFFSVYLFAFVCLTVSTVAENPTVFIAPFLRHNLDIGTNES